MLLLNKKNNNGHKICRELLVLIKVVLVWLRGPFPIFVLSGLDLILVVLQWSGVLEARQQWRDCHPSIAVEWIHLFEMLSINLLGVDGDVGIIDYIQSFGLSLMNIVSNFVNKKCSIFFISWFQNNF